MAIFSKVAGCSRIIELQSELESSSSYGSYDRSRLYSFTTLSSSLMALARSSTYGRCFSQPEAVVEGTDLGPEVDLRRLVELVLVHAAALVDDESEVGGARGEEVTERRVDVGAELVGDELVRHGTDQHYECGEGGIG